MKKVYFAIVIFLGVSSATFANVSDSIARRGRHNVSKSLSLSPEQHLQVDSLKQDMRSKLIALRSDSTIDKDSLRAAGKEIRSTHRAALSGILSPEQLDKSENMSARNHKHGQQHFANRRGGHHHQNLDESTLLELKDLRQEFVKGKKAIQMSRIAPEEQTRKIKELQAKYKEDRKELFKKSKGNKMV